MYHLLKSNYLYLHSIQDRENLHFRYNKHSLKQFLPHSTPPMIVFKPWDSSLSEQSMTLWIWSEYFRYNGMKIGYNSLSNMLILLCHLLSKCKPINPALFIKPDRNIQGCLNCYQADACLLS